jgi:hypothetical protein
MARGGFFMPHVLTDIGDFSAKLGPDERTSILDVQLPKRLQGIVSNFSTVDFYGQPRDWEADIVQCNRLSIHCNSGKVEGKLDKDYKNLRLDKQDDQLIFWTGNGRGTVCISLQVQSKGHNAHGGVLIPCAVGFSYAEVRAALADSMNNVPAHGYALIYSGGRPQGIRR